MDYQKLINELQAQTDKAEQLIISVVIASPAVMTILYSAIEKFA